MRGKINDAGVTPGHPADRHLAVPYADWRRRHGPTAVPFQRGASGATPARAAVATNFPQSRPWRVLPIALAAVISIVGMIGVTNALFHSYLPVPDPARYLGSLVQQADAATR